MSPEFPSDAILPEVLTCYLNLRPVRLQTQRFVRGMSAHLYPRDFATLPTPLLPADLQVKVQEKAALAMVTRRQSQILLDTATSAVDISIRDGEDAALGFLGRNGDAILNSAGLTSRL